MYRLILLLVCTFSLFSHEVSVSYFDKGRYAEHNIYLDDYQTKFAKQDLDSAYFIVLSYPLNPDSNILTMNASSSLGRFDLMDDELYAYSTYISARFAPFSILLFTPFVEVSVAGPTYLSKNSIGETDFESNVVYQNYVGAGLKFAAFVFDVKLLNYSKSLPTAFTKDSITLPIILSLGCSY